MNDPNRVYISTRDSDIPAPEHSISNRCCKRRMEGCGPSVDTRNIATIQFPRELRVFGVYDYQSEVQYHTLTNLNHGTIFIVYYETDYTYIHILGTENSVHRLCDVRRFVCIRFL